MLERLKEPLVGSAGDLDSQILAGACGTSGRRTRGSNNVLSQSNTNNNQDVDMMFAAEGDEQ